MKKDVSRLPIRQPLSCGAMAIVDEIERVESLTCGIWIGTGSRSDPASRAGLAHFYEHMLFKGTETRNAYRLAADIEACGGMINAYTSREQTAFYVRMPSEHLERGLEILCDMICNARFPEEELRTERDVVIQEIAQSFDTPDDHVFDAFQSQLYPRQKLGRPILGDRASIEATCRDDLQQHRAAHYYGENMVVSFSGRGDFARGVEFVEKALASLNRTPADITKPSLQSEVSSMARVGLPRFACSLSVEERDIEQCHSLVGFPAYSRHHEDYYGVQVLCALLGQGMASPLFQEIREKRGLAYSISSFYQAWQDGGLFALYTASDRSKMEELQRALRGCLNACTEALSDEDISRAKAQMRSSLVMGLESPLRRAGYWASSFLYYGELIDPRETLAKIASVDKASLLRLADVLFGGMSAITVLGPLSRMRLSEISSFGQAH